MSLPRVLIVDDHELILSVMEMVLRRKGFEPEIASNGNAAWDLIQTHEYALLITDIAMPGLGGTELIRRTKAHSPETRILAISGRGAAFLADAIDAGADDTLAKPFTAPEFFNLIDACTG